MKNFPVTIIQNKKHPKIQKHQPESFNIHPNDESRHDNLVL